MDFVYLNSDALEENQAAYTTTEKRKNDHTQWTMKESTHNFRSKRPKFTVLGLIWFPDID